MSLFVVLLALGVIGVVAAAAAGVVTGGLSPAPRERLGTALPPGRVGPEDVAALRFSTAPRGYRMDEVDAALARLREELAQRDAEARAAVPPPAAPPGGLAGEG